MKETDTRFDAAAFFGGTSCEAYRYLGAHCTRREGEDGYVFRVWAPNAARVSVVGDFCGWDAGAYPMARNAFGLWERFIPGLQRFDAYKYAVSSAQGKTVLKADPYALHAETRPGTASKLYDLPDYLRPGDCLILNNSRVLPARLLGHRLPGGGACEILLLIDRGENTWECLVRPGKKLRTGARVSFGDGQLTAEITEELPGGNRLVHFEYEGIFLEVLDRLGKMPLPPYIKEELQDRERYQTVYSKVNGSAAAPTAGLHFTPELLERVQTMGVKVGYVTLHVGLGTFRPVKEDTIEGHEMHSEYCVIPQETADLINETKRSGGRVICVGTTSCRTVESWAAEDGTMTASAGWTDIFIYPGYRFKVLDGLITNFHLPESTLIMLVSALAGREHVLAAYEEAVRQRYRFFSFGDAMFIASGAVPQA